MKRTRRGTLALIAGSSGVLAAETLATPTRTATRDARLAVVGDEDGYLGLTEDGLETGGVLFEGEPRSSPATFDIVNQLPEPISITLEADAFRFELADGDAAVDGRRLVVGDGTESRLGPGERLAGISVTPASSTGTGAAGSPPTVTGTIEITADGTETRLEADRDLSLVHGGPVVDRALLSMRRTGGSFEHRWLLEGLEVGSGLERLAFDYGGVETAGAIDFTAADDLSVTVVAGDTARSGTIDRRQRRRLAVSLARPVTSDGDDLEIVLRQTGPPASPGGRYGRPTGATVELRGAESDVSTTVDGIRERP